MDITSWHKEYQVGNPMLDVQHKHLLDLADNLFHSKSKADIVENFVLLDKFTREHYRDEEDLMKKSQYPEYEAHRKEHEMLLSKMDEFNERINKENLVDEEIRSFICMWLLDHVFGLDAEFGKFLQSVK